MSNEEKSFPKTSINWVMEEEEKTLTNPYKMGQKLSFLFTLF